MDLHYWGFTEVAGWQVCDLPTQVLFNFWQEMKTRRLKDINDQSRIGALGIAYKESVASKSPISFEKWLPFQFESSDSTKLKVSESTMAELKSLLADGALPSRMVKALIDEKVLKPGS
jgi:hypothetical protein